MVQRRTRGEWLRHVAVAAAYASGFGLLSRASFSHWVLFAGFRLGALWLLPCRYWPALIAGEEVPLAFLSASHREQFGRLWSLLIMLPPIAMAMPVVRRFHRYRPPAPAGLPASMGALLVCALLASAIWTLANMATLSATILPPGYPPLHYGMLGARWFIGNYLGVLTLAPAMLALRDAWPAGLPGRQCWRGLGRSRLLREAAAMLALLALLVWLGRGMAGDDLRQFARMAMFLPVIWLALRHGWHGSAIGGMAASVAVILTMPAKYDLATLQAEVFIAFAITTMLLLGGRISLLGQLGRQERLNARRALALARRAMSLGEAQLRQTSQALELIGEAASEQGDLLLGRARRGWPPRGDEQEYQRRAWATSRQLSQLAEGLHPTALRERGLAAALRDGAISRALDANRVDYWCKIQGDDAEQLPEAMQLALHRLACEVVNYLGATHNISDLALCLRCGAFLGRRWAMLQADALFSEGTRFRVHGGPLLYRLSATGLGLEAICDRAAIYEGKVRVRSSDCGERISLIVHEPRPEPESGVAALSKRRHVSPPD